MRELREQLEDLSFKQVSRPGNFMVHGVEDGDAGVLQVGLSKGGKYKL